MSIEKVASWLFIVLFSILVLMLLIDSGQTDLCEENGYNFQSKFFSSGVCWKFNGEGEVISRNITFNSGKPKLVADCEGSS